MFLSSTCWAPLYSCCQTQPIIHIVFISAYTHFLVHYLHLSFHTSDTFVPSACWFPRMDNIRRWRWHLTAMMSYEFYKREQVEDTDSWWWHIFLLWLELFRLRSVVTLGADILESIYYTCGVTVNNKCSVAHASVWFRRLRIHRLRVVTELKHDW